jgi:hypothetical protein
LAPTFSPVRSRSIDRRVCLAQPRPRRYTDGALGSWGYDARTQTLIDPTVSTDIMGYCKHQWISDYSYRGIGTRVAAVNGVTSARVVSPATSRWRIMLVDQRGPRWGIASPDEQLPEGSPEPATIYDGAGMRAARPSGCGEGGS